MEFLNVDYTNFIKALDKAQVESELVRAATTPAKDIEDRAGSSYYLSNTGQAGFAISQDGELTSVYSIAKGNGDIILSNAVRLGALHLDCFDGYLPTFYARHGFQEVRREPNWTPGEPDVVFMERRSNEN